PVTGSPTWNVYPSGVVTQVTGLPVARSTRFIRVRMLVLRLSGAFGFWLAMIAYPQQNCTGKCLHGPRAIMSPGGRSHGDTRSDCAVADAHLLAARPASVRGVPQARSARRGAWLAPGFPAVARG